MEWTERRELRRHIQGPAGAGQGWQREESGRGSGVLSNSRGSPLRSEVAEQPQEQLAFSSATAAAPARASVNEAAAAAELRDTPGGRGRPPPRPGHAPSQDWSARCDHAHRGGAMRWSD